MFRKHLTNRQFCRPVFCPSRIKSWLISFVGFNQHRLVFQPIIVIEDGSDPPYGARITNMQPKIFNSLTTMKVNPLSANPTKWSNISNSRRIVWVCLTILKGWRLKCYSKNWVNLFFHFFRSFSCIHFFLSLPISWLPLYRGITLKIFFKGSSFLMCSLFSSLINLGRRIDDLIPDNFLSSTTPFLRMICKQTRFFTR